MAEESAAPRFARGTPEIEPGKLPVPRWLWPAIAALGLLLLLQVVIGGRAALANDVATRPFVVAICKVFACNVPSWSEPAALQIVDHRIHAAPDHPGVLVVEASFRNDARWPQAWPLLQLTLSDINGVPIAQGKFAAAQYLAGAHAAEIGSGQTAAVQLNVTDPTQKAVSFDFALLPATGGVVAGTNTR
ncbi:DUF3426 domain-containing protein [Solilutibacter silvestris]|uniref:DUF3426 domain-containing protein n=1 Tax=Solilutibacter silvestris TaxID=1645665 RepID=A0A2K1Q207_9GAMM|nr:DUF3426 domain-containing protein [Lysobacter silvestris]PNS09066.1 hypothetical protein Lysil_0695 [Lysobacter silvestris]